MKHIAAALERFLEKYFEAALSADAHAVVRPVVVGPPADALGLLFAKLTANGTTNWTITVNGQPYEAIALFVKGDKAPGSNAPPVPLSQICNWDYAVQLRNSRPLFVTLAAAIACDVRHESLKNTTATLGQLTYDAQGKWLRDPVWRHIVEEIANAHGLTTSDVRTVLHGLAATIDADSATQSVAPWRTCDAVLGGSAGAHTGAQILAMASGLPNPNGATPDFPKAIETLRRLGKLIGAEGIQGGFAKLKTTATAVTDGLALHLDAAAAHLSMAVFSGVTFARAPSLYWQVPMTPPQWWEELTVRRLDAMLSEASIPPPRRDALRITCINALNPTGRSEKEPVLVRSGVRVRADIAGGGTIPTPSFERRQPRAAATPLTASAADPLECDDVTVPPHAGPVRYAATALGLREGVIEILDLDTFQGGGFARVAQASRNAPPTRRPADNRWEQNILLPRAGTIDLRIFHPSGASTVALTSPDGTIVTAHTSSHSSSVSVAADMEDGDEAEVVTQDAAGVELGRWTIRVTVDEALPTCRSRLEALIRANQLDRRPAVANAVYGTIDRLEASYLASPYSWKPVLACWDPEAEYEVCPDWSEPAPHLGDLTPPIDPRPACTPPAAFIAARDQLRLALKHYGRAVAEIDFAEPAIEQAALPYLDAYFDWLTQESDQAVWADTVAIYAAEWRPEANGYIPSTEPVTMLLSPLHPIRLAWHVLAQRQLLAASDAEQRCPAAGLLDPTCCPDSGAWALSEGPDSKVIRAFLAVETDHPHWAVLINRNYLGSETESPGWSSVRKTLIKLGLDTKGIAGGITKSQATDSIQQIVELQPARAVLRAGVVGTSNGTQAVTSGVLAWCESNFTAEDNLDVGPAFVEVFDTRNGTHPSEEALANVSQSTGERVRWFRADGTRPAPQLDITLLDQIGCRSPMTESGPTRAAISPDVVCRTRIREDSFRGMWLSETRVAGLAPSGSPTTPFAVLAHDTVTAFEGRADRDNSTHLKFQPLQQAIGTHLRNSTFVAVSSGQIDPACMVRGAASQHGFLWNFELPGILGGTEHRTGYYLIASAFTAMKEAVTRSARLVTSRQIDADELLEEVSHRGIPVLKRLVGGGTASRGEIGMLLAVRLLQDVFRSQATSAQLPVICGECIHLMLPVDPFHEAIDEVRAAIRGRESSAQRSDFLVVAIRLPHGPRPVQIKITPVEVKFREVPMPGIALKAALQQAANLATLLDLLWCQPAKNSLWETCRAALLAQLLDYAFRLYAQGSVHRTTPAAWAGIHQRVLQDVLGRTADVFINTAGRLVVFDGSASSTLVDIDGDGRLDTAVVVRADAESVLTGQGSVANQIACLAKDLDLTFPSCTAVDQTAPLTAQEPQAVATLGTNVESDNGHLCADQPNITASVGSPAVDISSPEDTPEPAEALAGDQSACATPDGSRTNTQDPTGSFRSAGVPESVRVRVRQAFEGFIGNAPVIDRIGIDLISALIEAPPHLSKNYLLTGQPSTGKTELAKRIANALGLPFVRLDGRGLTSRERLFELIDGALRQNGLAASQVGTAAGLPEMEYPALTVFIDEAHLTPRPVQESLLTMLEAADRTVTLQSRIARITRTTFLFATTRKSELDPALRSRCSIVELREYETSEVAEIVRLSCPENWPAETFLGIAQLGRSVPRIAIDLAQELKRRIGVAEVQKQPDEHLDDVRRSRELDERGLSRLDIHYLELLEAADRALGERALLNMLGTVDPETVLNEVEPFLRRLNLIRLGRQGREITNEGRSYVLERRRRNST